ncbi:MAG: LacI family DNA-binding transcriptional regulator [Verrucomicrobiota bacterium]
MAVTIVDVAKACGVHSSTVSRALNNRPEISPALRKKVFEVARKLNYRPSAAARVMGGFGNETIGLVTEIESGFTSYGASLIEGISLAVSSMDLKLATNAVHWGSSSEEIQRLPVFKTDCLDGVILDVHRSEGNIEPVVQGFGIPFVFVNPANKKELNAVMPDDVAVAEQATRYLLDRGHRAVAYVPCLKTSHCSQAERMQGYRNAMRDSGNLSPLLFEMAGKLAERVDHLKWNVPSQEGAEKLASYLRTHSVSGFVTYSSFEAAWLCSALPGLGCRIPEDISIVSCDYAAVLEYLLVPVTSFVLDRVKMGQMAVEMLQERIDGKGEDRPAILVEGVLWEGGSVATLPRN